jgi:hypothetical protein
MKHILTYNNAKMRGETREMAACIRTSLDRGCSGEEVEASLERIRVVWVKLQGCTQLKSHG